MHRQFTFKETFKNPWCSQAAENVHFGVFYERFQAVEDFHIHFGGITEIKRNKKTENAISFTHFECLKFHIEKIIGKDKLEKYFLKENKSGVKAKVVITKEKPAIMSYKLPTGSLTLSIHY